MDLTDPPPADSSIPPGSKILHLTWLPRTAGYEGILHKQQDLAVAATRAGIPLEVRILSLDPGPDGLVIPIRPLVAGRLRKLAVIEASIDLSPYSAIILRYPGAVDLALGGFLARHGRRVVTEHHTDEIAELRQLPGGWLRSRWEWHQGRRFLAGVAGAIAVTRELALRLPRRGLRGPSTVIGNGINTQEIPWRPPRPWLGPGPLRLAFAGGVFWPWQGLDRLLQGILAAERGSVSLDLVGRVRSGLDLALLERCRRERPDQVRLHGVLHRQDLSRLLGEVHGAVSSLALHRKGMEEACPLKSRDYLAHGLPLITAYRDPDLPDHLPGIFAIPSNETPVDIPQVLATWSAWRDPWDMLCSGLRQHAEHHLDLRAKAQAMVAFARTCVRP